MTAKVNNIGNIENFIKELENFIPLESSMYIGQFLIEDLAHIKSILKEYKSTKNTYSFDCEK